MKHLRRLTLTLALLLSVVAVYAGGIKNAKELLAFVTAINKGEDYSAFKNEKGESVRKDAKFDKQYLEGKYGADPYLRRIIDWGKVNA